jgi:hypothetical protein
MTGQVICSSPAARNALRGPGELHLLGHGDEMLQPANFHGTVPLI